LFSYSTDGVLWSDAFDDVIVGNITITGAATIYFRIAPYFAGETGTYLLDMSITRSSVVGVQAPEMQNAIHVYPNPAKEVLKVDLDGINHQVKQADLVSIQGQTVFISSKFDNSKTFTIPLADIADGVYFLKIQTNEGTTTKKVVVAK